VLKYKGILIEKGLAEATINRRLSAIKALVNYARRIGKCDWSLTDVKGEKVQPYRGTSEVSVAGFKKMAVIPSLDTLKRKWDYALLRLLWENALRRRGEVSKANVGDFEPDAGKLLIYGKGRGSQGETITLSFHVVAALEEWLLARGSPGNHAPLFCALDRAQFGHRLSTTPIYRIVRGIARQAGIKKAISPHRIRHSAVTAALYATQGDVRQVQNFSRHANLDALMIYDDNRLDV
jgi:integrase/recombinase XerC